MPSQRGAEQTRDSTKKSLAKISQHLDLKHRNLAVSFHFHENDQKKYEKNVLRTNFVMATLLETRFESTKHATRAAQRQARPSQAVHHTTTHTHCQKYILVHHATPHTHTARNIFKINMATVMWIRFGCIMRKQIRILTRIRMQGIKNA